MRIGKYIFVLLISIQAVCQEDTALVDLEKITKADMDSLGYRNYQVPVSLYVPQYGGRIEKPENKLVNTDRLFVIGWSGMGYLAYVVEPFSENNDAYYAEIYVQDLKTNDIVWFRRYDNESYERKWEHSNEIEKDSLAKTFTCYYLKCWWYSIYEELSDVLFRYDIEPTGQEYDLRQLNTDQKYVYSHIDTLEGHHISKLRLFFQYDVDTFRYAYPVPGELSGLNYHGYLANPELTEWNAILLSERHSGLDSSRSETWHYKIIGFRRHPELPFGPNILSIPKGPYNGSPKENGAYRHSSLVELMSDRAVTFDPREWFESYGASINVDFGKSGSRSRYQKAFRSRFRFEGDEYILKKRIRHATNSYNLYGADTTDQATQLICYNSDSGEVQYWYDLRPLMESGSGSIRWVEVEDSLLYVSFGTDSTGEGTAPFGKILCLDTKTHTVVWVSTHVCINSESFVLHNDLIYGGFSGNENDYISIVNKYTGETIRTVTLLSDPMWFSFFGDHLYVLTRLSSHDFKVESTFFESY